MTLAKRTEGAPLSEAEHRQRVEAARASAAARRKEPSEKDEETRFRDYVREVHAIPMLSAERERALAVRMRQGDDRARDELVEAHLRLVTSSARKLAGYGLPQQDLVAAGNIGLLQAAEKFDPDKGTRFVTLALPYIRSAQFRHVLDNWSIVRLGTNRDQRRLFFSLREAKARIGELENVEGKDSADAIAGRLRVKTSSVVDMERRLGAKDTRLSAPTGEGEDSEDMQSRLAANTPSPEAEMISAQTARAKSAALAGALKGLPERERQIIEARHLSEKPPTLQEMGDKLGISAERVRQLEAQALRRMRRSVAGMEKLAKFDPRHAGLSEAQLRQRREAAKARWQGQVLAEGEKRWMPGGNRAAWKFSRRMARLDPTREHAAVTYRDQPGFKAVGGSARSVSIDPLNDDRSPLTGKRKPFKFLTHSHPGQRPLSRPDLSMGESHKLAIHAVDQDRNESVFRGIFRDDSDEKILNQRHRVDWHASRVKAADNSPGDRALGLVRDAANRLQHPEGYSSTYRPGAAAWRVARNLLRLRKSLDEDITAAAAATDPWPTWGQAQAGNYRKGTVDLYGLPITIETPAGAWRQGRGWRTQMPGHYGYVRGTLGADGDAVDVTLGPASHVPDCPVFVVKQVNPTTGTFDEWKSFVGYWTEAEAIRAYDESFSDGSGPRRRALVRRMSLDDYKIWLSTGGGRLEKREKGAPLSDAEHEQRVQAARARWGATGAGVGLAVGVLAAPAASRAYAGRVAQEKDFRPAAERAAQRYALYRHGKLDQALDERNRQIGRSFTNTPAEGEWGTRRTPEGKTIPSMRGRKQGPVSREVRRLRGAIARDRARAEVLTQHLKNIDEAVADPSKPWPKGPGETAARRELRDIQERMPRWQAQMDELQAARPWLKGTRRGGTVRRRTEGFAQEVGQPIGMRADHRAWIPPSIPDERVKQARVNVRQHMNGQYGLAAQRVRARWGDFIPRFEKEIQGRFVNTIAGKLRGRARLVAGLAGAALGAGAGYALAKAAPDEPVEAPDPAEQEAEIARRLAGLFQRWRDDPSRLGNQDDVREAMGPLYAILADAADSVGGEGPPAETSDGGRRIVATFDARNPEVERRLRDYALDRIRAITGEVRETIRGVLVDASMRGTPVEEQAREIRDSIGLSPGQKGWVSSYRRQLQTLDPRVLDRALRDRRHDKPIERAIRTGTPLSEADIERYVDSYHRRALAYRATTIARTEALRGANTGLVESARMMLRDNPDLTVEKTWIATGDDRTRDAHRELNGKTVTGLDAPFQIRDPKTGAMETIRWPHDDQASAGMVVNCRCTLGLRIIPRPEYGRMTAVAV